MLRFVKYISPSVLLALLCQMGNAEPQTLNSPSSVPSESMTMHRASAESDVSGGYGNGSGPIGRGPDTGTSRQMVQSQGLQNQIDQEEFQDRALQEILSRRDKQIKRARQQAAEMDARYHEQIQEAPQQSSPPKDFFQQPIPQKASLQKDSPQKESPKNNAPSQSSGGRDVSVALLEKIAEEKRLQFEIADAYANLAKIRAEIKAEASHTVSATPMQPDSSSIQQDNARKRYTFQQRFNPPVMKKMDVQGATRGVMDEHGNIASKDKVMANSAEDKSVTIGEQKDPPKHELYKAIPQESPR